jgi:hypothetical protein
LANDVSSPIVFARSEPLASDVAISNEFIYMRLLRCARKDGSVILSLLIIQMQKIVKLVLC